MLYSTHTIKFISGLIYYLNQDASGKYIAQIQEIADEILKNTGNT